MLHHQIEPVAQNGGAFFGGERTPGGQGAAFEPLRIQRLGQEQHYLGPLNGPELLVVLPEAKAVGSVAMSMLGSDADLGVVLFTSRDASHYQQGQGTQLLHEIALMLPELLERWIERV